MALPLDAAARAIPLVPKKRSRATVLIPRTEIDEPGQLRRQPVLHLEIRDPVEIPGVASDDDQVPGNRDRGDPEIWFVKASNFGL
jgi:hypothetical protein